jgi:hypothetical protein
MDIHDPVYLVTTKVVPGEIYPIIGHTSSRFGERERRKDKPAKEGTAIFFVGPELTPRIDEARFGIRAADGAVVAMPLVEITGGTINGDGEVEVELAADGEPHALATLPTGSWVRRITDAETGWGPLDVLSQEEDLALRAYFPGTMVLSIETHDGRARTVVNVAFV